MIGGQDIGVISGFSPNSRVGVSINSVKNLITTTFVGTESKTNSEALFVVKTHLINGTWVSDYPRVIGKRSIGTSDIETYDPINKKGDLAFWAKSASGDQTVFKATSSEKDTDGDGLLDIWETNGIDINDDGIIDLDLKALGANPNIKDIFVEVDSMVGLGPSKLTVGTNTKGFPTGFTNLPSNLKTGTSLDGVVKAFLDQGIKLHIDLRSDQNLTRENWNTNPFPQFDAIKAQRFGNSNDRTSSNKENILLAKSLVYRYAIFADSYKGSISGKAELGGNDFLVTLGKWGTPGGTARQQAGTFMHELGHVLGLRHGGADNIRYKPNYHSVMNYTWQIPKGSSTHSKSSVRKYHASWELDYSDRKFNTLDESNLNELIGIGGHPGHVVPIGLKPGTKRTPFTFVRESGFANFDRDKVKDTKSEINDINGRDAGSKSPDQILESHDDWQFIKANLKNWLKGTDFADGAHLTVDLTEDQYSFDDLVEENQALDDFEESDIEYSIITDSPTFSEGDSGSQPITFTITRSGAIQDSSTIDYNITGTATNITDYNNIGGSSGVSTPTGTINFSPGEIDKTITLDALGDIEIEPDETINITLSNGTTTNGTVNILTSNATTTLKNDDPPSLTDIDYNIATDTVKLSESDTGFQAVTFTITRSGATQDASTIDYVITGTATNEDDYNNIGGTSGATTLSGTATFTAGETEKNITLDVLGDTDFEPDEIIEISLSNGTAPNGTATISTASATSTIENDDPASPVDIDYSIATNTNTLSEGDSGEQLITFSISRSGATQDPSTIDYTIAGTATNTIDYNNIGGSSGATVLSGTITFAAGETEKIITLDVLGDTDFEPDETIDITLSNGTAPNGTATISSGTTTTTIENDDPAPPINIDYSTITDTPTFSEGDTGFQTVTFTIARSGATQDASTIDYAITGTATNGDDYNNIGGTSGATTLSGTVAFAAGETEKTITLDVLGDTDFEPDETIDITLSNGTAPNGTATISVNTARTIIENDDSSNIPPDAVNDSATTALNTPISINVLSNDSDSNGDTIFITSFDTTSIEGGTISLDDNSTPTDLSDDQLIYTPASNFTGTDIFTYAITDGTESSTATVSIGIGTLSTTDLNTLTPEQLVQSIIGAGVSFSNVAFTGDLLAGGLFTGGNAEGLGVEAGVILSSGNIASTAGPNDNDGTTTEFGTPGDADLDNLIPGAATQDAAVLEFDFIPQQGEISFQYVFASEEYNEFVDQFNDAFAFFLNEENIALLPGTDTPISINTINNVENSAFFNDNDFSDFGTPTPFNTEFDGFTTVLTARATVTPNEINRIKLVVADNLDGALDSAVFLVAGSFVSTVNAVDDTATTFINQAVEIPVLANDSDPDGDPLQIESFDLNSAQGGTISLNDNNTPSDFTDDQLVYTPATDFVGTDSFTYSVSDGGANASATVEVTVEQPINTPPVAVSDTDNTNEDTSLTLLASDLLNNDSDADSDPLTITEVDNPTNGTVALNSNGDVVFTPTTNFNGLASFEYTISDGTDTATATVEITVNPVNDVPVATDDTYTLNEDTTLIVTIPNGVLENDQDIDGDSLTATVVTGPANGVLNFNPNGTFEYIPQENFNGTDSFTYKVNDGTTESNEATVTLSVTDTPDDSGMDRILEGLQVLYTFDASEGGTVFDTSGVGTPLDLTIQDLNTVNWGDGILTVDAGTLISSEEADSKLKQAISTTQEITIEAWVTPDNTTQDGPARIVTLSRDIRNRNFTLGQANDTYDVRLRTTQTGLNGNRPSLLSPEGAVTERLTHVLYTREADGDTHLYIDNELVSSQNIKGHLSNWNANYQLALANELTGDRPWSGTYDLVAIYNQFFDETEVAQNFLAGSDTPTPNSAPTANDDQFRVGVNTNSIPLDILLNDIDINGDALSISILDNPTHGTAEVNDNGTPTDVTDDFISYTPDPDFLGIDALTYEVADGRGETDTAVATIQVIDPTLRVQDGLQVLYTFDAGNGNIVHDTSGVGDPLNLTINDLNTTAWGDGTLTVDVDTLISSNGRATKLNQAISTTNEITIEAWITPDNASQDGPARIVTLSQNTRNRNFTLGQEDDTYDVRLRTTKTGRNGNRPSLTSPNALLTDALTHLVYTRDETGQAHLYIDNELVAADTIKGDLSNWNDDYEFALANELTGDRPWAGTYDLVAVYNQAFDAEEVSQNYLVGTGASTTLNDNPFNSSVNPITTNLFAQNVALS